MSNSKLPIIPSFRKQHLFLEFACLRLRCPEGIYLSLTPGDSSFWSGVFFVRTGPYSPAVLRFNISFPSQYPDLPPLVTFATDIFHPLLVSLTTYTFSTSASDANETVSASDEERLPPGGFSLRDGFPHWFRRQGRVSRAMMDSSPQRNTSSHRPVAGSGDASAEIPSVSPIGTPQSPSFQSHEPDGRSVDIAEVLSYIKSTFEDPKVLDKLPLEVAGNPGAWHAWRSYRGICKAPSRSVSPADDGRPDPPTHGPQAMPRDWNWEGVWESRVKSGIENSLSDSVLFGPKGGRGNEKKTEMIRFSKLDEDQLKEIREGNTEMQSKSREM